MDIVPIRTDADYREALKKVNAYFDAPEGSPEADTLDVLVVLVEEWELRHYPVALPSPISAKYSF